MELLGFFSYIMASLAYFAFILLLLAARNNTLSGRLVLSASIISLIALLLNALQLQQHFSMKILFLAENIKILFLSLLILSTKEGVQFFHQLLKNKVIQKHFIFWLIISSFSWISASILNDGIKYLFMLFLVLNLWSLVLLEQLYRNAEKKSKWALWPLIIALGSMFVFDFILFAQASMLNHLTFNLWYMRGIIATFGVPFLLISTRRMKDWSVNVFISRDVVFYSSMLLISGCYLLVMASAGYVINFIGGHWGNAISLAFIILGGVVLIVLLMTERLRKEVKVFITKHFFANKYEYKDEWLKLIKQLELSSNTNYYKTALNCICSTLEISNGAIVKKQSLKCYNVLYNNGITMTQDLFYQLDNIDQYCQKKPWIIDIREYFQIENSYSTLVIDTTVFAQTNISIIIPIMIGDQLNGFFLLSSPSSQVKLLNWEDRDLLFAIAKQLSHYLSLNEANEKLSEAKQFDAFNRMSAFLVHDLKNIQAQLALINSNAKKHRDNPEFIEDTFATVKSATTRLDKVLTQLRTKTMTETKLKKCNIQQLLHTIVKQRNVDQPVVELTITETITIRIEEEIFCSVINHLIQNAQEATSNDGWVKIKASYFDERLNIAITDNGCGMSQDFIEKRLFKPFDTTKGNAGMGIGVFEAKQYIESIGGRIQVTSFENKGTTFHLTIPNKKTD